MTQLMLFGLEDTKQEIPLEEKLKNLSIIEVGLEILGNQIKKQPIGPNYIGLCFVHMEKTPSFYLKPQWNFGVCYGCHFIAAPVTLPFQIEANYQRHQKYHEESKKSSFGIPYPNQDSIGLPNVNAMKYFAKKIGLNPNNEVQMKIFNEYLHSEERRLDSWGISKSKK